MSLTTMRYGSWRWMVATTLAALLSLTTLLALQSGTGLTPGSPGASFQAAPPTSAPASPLAELASSHPGRQVEVIVQFHAGTDPAAARALVSSVGGDDHPRPADHRRPRRCAWAPLTRSGSARTPPFARSR